jgi:CubicO group peptidase (beta-lactamase class C family)
MNVKALISVVSATLISYPVFADGLPISAPENVGLSSQRLVGLREFLKSEIKQERIPGATVAIARKGQLAYFETFGFLNAATKEPMPRDAIFSIASMTKPMVSVAVMMLHDEGKLLLSDPIGKYLPALGKMQVGVVKTDSSGKSIVETVPAQRQPTIQDFLRHTSGFTYGGRGTTEVHKMWPAASSSMSLTYTGSEFLTEVGKLPLLYQPGTVWDYSLSTDVLGLLVEKISGKSLGAFLNERIWKPLGMVDTDFSVTEVKQARYARAYPNDPLTNSPQFIVHASGKPLKFECGGACAVSTTMDYLLFAQMLANGGAINGQRLLSRKTVDLMTTDQLAPDVRARSTHPLLSPGFGFGLGFTVRTHTGLASIGGSVGEYAWGGAFGTYFWVDPKEQLAAVYMSAAPGEIFMRNRTVVKNLIVQSIND